MFKTSFDDLTYLPKRKFNAKWFLIPCIVISIGCGFANAQDNIEDSHARAIRLSLEVGGMNAKGYPLLSKNHGPFLSKLGFCLISPTNYTPKREQYANPTAIQ